MTRLLFIFPFCLACLLTKNVTAQKNDLLIYQASFDHALKSWTKTFGSFKLSSFKPAGTVSFEEIKFDDASDLKEFYSVYKPVLAFSNDGSQFIDIYSYQLNLEKKGDSIISYGSEVDQVISLCNLRTRKWNCILFCGSTLHVQEAIWVTATKFILAAVAENENSKYKPVLYLGDTKKNMFEYYVCGDKECYQNKTYNSAKLAKLNIQEQ